MFNSKIYNKITEYLFYIFVFLLPFQTRYIFHYGLMGGEKWEYGSMSLYLSDIILLLLFFAFCLDYFNTTKTLKHENTKTKLQKIKIASVFLCFCVFVFSSIIQAQDRALSLYYWTMFAAGGILYYLTKKINFSLKKFVTVFIASAVIQSLLGIWQFVAQEVFANKWFGMAYQSPKIAGVSVVETTLGRWLRAYGALPHPNVLGGFLALAFLMLIWLYVESQEHENPPTGDHSQSDDKTIEQKNIQVPKHPSAQALKNIFFIITGFVILSGLFFTFSRSAWLALGVGLLVLNIRKRKNTRLALGEPRRTKTQKQVIIDAESETKDIESDRIAFVNKRLFIFLFYNFLWLVVLAVVFQEPLLNRVADPAARLERMSVAERQEQYHSAATIIKNNFLFGVGLGNYTHASCFMLHDSCSYLQPVHNVFVLALTELGIIGFVIWLWIVLRASSLFNKKDIIVSQNTFNFKYTFLAALLVIVLLDHYFWSLHFGIFLFWLILVVNAKIIRFRFFD